MPGTGGLTAATGITDALKSQAFPELQQAVFRNNEVFGLFEQIPWLGGTTFPVKIQYSGNGSFETYTEGDAPPSPGVQSYITANFPEAHYHGMVQITGHAMDYTKGGSDAAVFFNLIVRELQDGLRDGVAKASVDMLGTGLTAPVGIQGIVDDAGTLAGLSRTTYTWWKAVENSGAATTLAISDLDILKQDIKDNVETGMPGNPNLVLCSFKQERIMRQIGGFIPGNSTATTVVRTMMGANGPDNMNLGFQSGGLKYGDAPIVPLHDLTNSIVLYIERETFKIAQLRPWTVDPLAKNDDTSKVYITAAFSLLCLRPRSNGKITTLTA